MGDGRGRQTLRKVNAGKQKHGAHSRRKAHAGKVHRLVDSDCLKVKKETDLTTAWFPSSGHTMKQIIQYTLT